LFFMSQLVSRQETSIPCTQKMALLRSTACCVVQHCYSLCCGQVHLAVASFFVPQQETTHCSISHHCSLFQSKKRHTASFRGIARHGVSCCGIVCCAVAMFSHGATARMGGGKKTINLCGIGHHGGVVVLQRLYLSWVF